jgi:hypothetical protein
LACSTVRKLAGIGGFRIGINWHGRHGNGEHLKRDPPLKHFAAWAQFPGVTLISLQKSFGIDGRDVANECLTIVDLGSALDTVQGAFMDTAAIIMNLDLVISSDSAVPNLAGALGVPVWLALPFVPNWRWLLDRSDCPWNPTMRLFRQRSIGNWTGVFSEIEAALHQLMREPACT